jgi:hypothetical protein
MVPASEVLEEELLQWIRQLRDGRQRVTRKMLMKEAARRYRVLYQDGSFHCQRGLAKTLLQRKTISLRRRTAVSQRLPRELALRISNHLRTVRNLRKARNYSADQIAAVDETGLWVDMPGNSTLEEVGSRTIAIKTTAHEKVRFTVVLGARADGSKCTLW